MRGGGGPFQYAAATMMEFLDLTLTANTAKGQIVRHSQWWGRGGLTGESRRRRRRVFFRSLICAAKVPVPPLTTRDNAASCRGCLLPARKPPSARAEAAPGMLSETMTSAVGGRDDHASKRINRITVVKSVLFYSNIYIFCRVVAWHAEVTVGKGMTTSNKENWKRCIAYCSKRCLRCKY